MERKQRKRFDLADGKEASDATTFERRKT